MKAAIFREPYRIELHDVDMPPVADNEVLLAVRAAGICGSDLHFYSGDHPYAQYPSVFGHELAGIVERMGSASSRFRPGDRVVVEPAIPCGRCYPCRNGKYNCCANMQFIGAFGRQGGFAEYVAVPESCLHKMPEGMPFPTGALCEPFAIGAHAVNRAGVTDGCTVTILGMGPIGLTMLILLRQLHNVRVFAVDVVPERLETAAAFGADETVNARTDDPVEAIRTLTDGELSNVVIEAVGLKRTMEQTIHLVSSGGRIVIVGLTRDDVAMRGVLYTNKEAEIFGSRNSVNCFMPMLEFLHRHPDQTRRFITAELPFADIAEAFRMAKTRTNTINKIVLTLP